MCGRYITAQQEKFERALRVGRIRWRFTASFNVAPTQSVPVVRIADGEVEGVMMRWGLIPFWAHGVPPKFSCINATLEKLETAASWRGPWKRGQRCILPAAGFYEWHLEADGRKSPFFIHLSDREVFGFAGIWDRSINAAGEATESCAIVTLPGNELLRDIHNTGANPYRMPAILAEADQEAWLRGSAQQAHGMLQPYPAELMVAWRVSTRVNSPRNDDASLTQAVA